MASVPDLERIGRYRVGGRLGSGAFATVFLADDDVLESHVAIKVLADNWAFVPDIRARFEQEGQILRRADSDRLVRVLDIGELPDHRPYLVMNYATGGTLADRLDHGPLQIDEALRIAGEIARAVAVLHEVGVLHRDLKPSNVLFSSVGGRERILVADLGLAKAIAHASGFTVTAGTPGYMAPEQADAGAGLDTRADVYAMGALLYHMVTGRPPGGVPLIRRSRRPGIPARLEPIVLRALSPDPRRRQASALEFAEDVDRLRKAMARPASRAARVVRHVLEAVVVVAVVLAAGGAVPATSAPPGWVRLDDATGALSLAVPRPWARQFRDAGWNPAVIRLTAGRAPGLLIGASLDRWADQADPAVGVFAGLSPELRRGRTAPALPVHDGCTRQADRTVTVGSLAGSVQRYTGCPGSVSFSEVVLTGATYGVYLQVKQVDGVDRTDEIVHQLRIADDYS
jgi:hypothetical protein